MHSTNYVNTLITVAEDCPVSEGTPPVGRPEKPTIAMQQYAMLAGTPYRYTSDDVIFTVWADRHGIGQEAIQQARDEFFRKGQPCLRTSPLARRHGYGIHADADGHIALVPMESDRYKALSEDPDVTCRAAMRTSRK